MNAEREAEIRAALDEAPDDIRLITVDYYGQDAIIVGPACTRFYASARANITELLGVVAQAEAELSVVIDLFNRMSVDRGTALDDNRRLQMALDARQPEGETP